MKAPTPHQIRRRVRYWQRRLDLTGWSVKIEIGPDAEGASASCLAQPEYRSATVRFDPAKIPAEELDAFCVHELCHCLVWPLANAAHVMAGGDGPKEEWVRTMEEELTTALERLIVKLAA